MRFRSIVITSIVAQRVNSGPEEQHRMARNSPVEFTIKLTMQLRSRTRIGQPVGTPSALYLPEALVHGKWSRTHNSPAIVSFHFAFEPLMKRGIRVCSPGLVRVVLSCIYFWICVFHNPLRCPAIVKCVYRVELAVCDHNFDGQFQIIGHLQPVQGRVM